MAVGPGSRIQVSVDMGPLTLLAGFSVVRAVSTVLATEVTQRAPVQPHLSLSTSSLPAHSLYILRSQCGPRNERL